MSLPDRAAIMAFVRQTPSAVGKREIARAFGLHGEEREALKALLQEMMEEGLLDSGPGRTLHKAGELPRVAVLKVTSADGARVVAEPDRWEGEGAPPQVLVGRGERGRGRPSERLQPGDRLLCRIEGDPGSGPGQGRYLGTVIKRLARGTSGAKALILGVVRADRDGGFRLKPVDKRARLDFALHHAENVTAGELVRAEIKGSGARMLGHVVERLGDPFATGALSAIAIAAKGIPEHFSDAVLADAEAASVAPLGEREDWTAIPFITIDPADARDHDDAVWAEADGAGFRLIVAIADVSWFVRPGSALDRSAFDRGNSVYFPDRVVPMLPEALSNGACSLKAGADKAVLACDMRLAANGEVLKYRFHRARIRVVANLAYESAQAIIDGTEDSPLKASVLDPLWACWGALKLARKARGPLELDLPEKRVELDAAGNVLGVKVRAHLDAHQVIEDMMIAANVAAALALEEKKRPVMYRCHEAPDRMKLLSLKEYLGTMGVSFALGQVVTPATFNRILEKAKGRDDMTEISEAVLRSQTQAYYAPRNTGHFGLALGSYGHFTSPIRRYADCCVHRALVSGFKLGEGGLSEGAEQRFAPIGEHISLTERRAMEAERETLDRYIARHLAQTVGQVVRARISGVQAFGFFATVDGIGGDGLVPVSALGAERFRFDEAGRYLEGLETGTRFGVGQRLDLRLEDADLATGGLRFSLPGVEPAPRDFGRTRIRRDAGKPRRGGPPPGVKRGRG